MFWITQTYLNSAEDIQYLNDKLIMSLETCVIYFFLHTCSSLWPDQYLSGSQFSHKTEIPVIHFDRFYKDKWDNMEYVQAAHGRYKGIKLPSFIFVSPPFFFLSFMSSSCHGLSNWLGVLFKILLFCVTESLPIFAQILPFLLLDRIKSEGLCPIPHECSDFRNAPPNFPLGEDNSNLSNCSNLSSITSFLHRMKICRWYRTPSFPDLVIRCTVIQENWAGSAWWWAGDNEAFYSRQHFAGLVFLNLGSIRRVCYSLLVHTSPPTGSGFSLIVHFAWVSALPVYFNRLLFWVLRENFLYSNIQ